MSQDHLTDEPVVVDQHPLTFGPSLWEIVWQRKAYVVFGIVLGLVLGVLFYFVAPKTYESTAQIFVVKKQPDRPISASASTNPGSSYTPGPVEDFLDTHQTILKSAVVVTNAIEKEQLAQLPTFQDSKRPARDLVDALKVARDRDKTAGRPSNSQVLNISFRCRNYDDSQKVLGALVASYHDFLNNSSQGSANEALKLISKARDLVQNDLDEKDREFIEFQKETPVVWKNERGTSLYQERLAAIDTQRASRAVRKAELRKKLDAVETAIKEERPRAEVLVLLSAVSGHTPMMRLPTPRQKVPGMVQAEENAPLGPTTGTLEQELIQLQLQEGRLLEDYGPQHPTVQSLRERMYTIRYLLAPSTTPEGQTPKQQQRNARVSQNFINLKLGQLRQEYQDVQRDAETAETLFRTELEEAKKVVPLELQAEAMRKSMERSKMLYDNIIKRLQEMDLISNFGGYDAQVITPPTEPEKVFPRAYIVLPLAAVVGIFLGLGLVFLAEQTDRTFRSPEDIRRRLGLPVLGVIPVLKSAARAKTVAVADGVVLDPSLYAWTRPKSKEAEAYRGVRTALFFSTRGQGSKVIQVTSPNPGDGKSTLAANLAISIAQSSKRVLLVDADMRRPTVNKLFGLANEVGFAMVLGGMADLPDAIQQSSIPYLSLLPSGVVPPNPAELLISPRLHEVLAWMRDHYDYIVIDTPPLLAVTDPGVVGSQVDGVLLTVRSSKTNRLEAKRAREVLHNLGARVIGVIVNATELSQSSYGYGYYGDRDGYYARENEEGQNGVSDRPHNRASECATGETNGVPAPKG